MVLALRFFAVVSFWRYRVEYTGTVLLGMRRGGLKLMGSQLETEP